MFGKCEILIEDTGKSFHFFLSFFVFQGWFCMQITWTIRCISDIHQIDNPQRPYSPSTFKSSSKFSDDFIVHFPEKSAVFLSMLTLSVGVFTNDRLGLFVLLLLTGLLSSLLCLHLPLHWLADTSSASGVDPTNTDTGGRVGLSPWYPIYPPPLGVLWKL